jgi:transcription initiation factor TFIIIB Brf1 subunit/transcription initiation factor TFIIB
MNTSKIPCEHKHRVICHRDGTEVCSDCARVLEENLFSAENSVSQDETNNLSKKTFAIARRIKLMEVMSDLAHLPEILTQAARERIVQPTDFNLKGLGEMHCTEEEWLVCLLFLVSVEFSLHRTLRDLAIFCGQSEVKLWRILKKMKKVTCEKENGEEGERNEALVPLQLIESRLTTCCAHLNITRREPLSIMAHQVGELYRSNFSCPLRSLIAATIYSYVKERKSEYQLTMKKIACVCRVSLTCIKRLQRKVKWQY